MFLIVLMKSRVYTKSKIVVSRVFPAKEKRLKADKLPTGKKFLTEHHNYTPSNI
jgi:hypothetical protein